MKLYHHLREGRFIRRVNRFIAEAALEGETVAVHVKNTGRLAELFLPGAAVWLEETDNPARKTRYDLVCVENRGYAVNIDSQATNPVFREWAEKGRWAEGLQNLKGEVFYGDSRFDFAYERNGVRGYVEVKGVTLFNDEGMAFFPDAPTERGVKHLRGLVKARREGCEAGVCFILQRDGVVGMKPNDRTHPAFGQALREAALAGVTVRALSCHVTPEGCEAVREVPVVL